jgi:uncharacterized protein (UPF0332 family)
MGLWVRALRSLASAKVLVQTDPDSAAPRAYYAAFDAVSTLLELEGKTFSKHAGVEAAVHRDLIHTGRWPADLGKAYSDLAALRVDADYTGPSVTITKANDAIAKAEQILQAVRLVYPHLAPTPPPPQP